MPPKRKAAQGAAKAWAKEKRPKNQSAVVTVTEVVPEDAPLSRRDLASLVETITNKVTQQVMANLTQAGLTSVRNTEEGNARVQPGNAPHPIATVVNNESEVGPTEQSVISVAPSPSIAPFPQTNIPLYAHVDDKLRARIWADEFIDLGKLLQYTQDDSYVLSVGGSGNKPTISLQPRSEEKIYHIDKWTRAFQIFMSVYTLKRPEQAPNLLKYCDVVRDLASKNYNWRMYDDSFRRMRESNPIPWEQVLMELWVRAAHSGTYRSDYSQLQPFRGEGRFLRQGFQGATQDRFPNTDQDDGPLEI